MATGMLTKSEKLTDRQIKNMAHSIVESLRSAWPESDADNATYDDKIEAIESAVKKKLPKASTEQQKEAEEAISEEIARDPPFITATEVQAINAALQLAGYIATDFESDHREMIAGESIAWWQHKLEEPNCSYCQWISTAKSIVKTKVI